MLLPDISPHTREEANEPVPPIIVITIPSCGACFHCTAYLRRRCLRRDYARREKPPLRTAFGGQKVMARAYREARTNRGVLPRRCTELLARVARWCRQGRTPLRCMLLGRRASAMCPLGQVLHSRTTKEKRRTKNDDHNRETGHARAAART
ncbi:hypothetical protein MRX96_033591 [Rhipicephalus microplus]